MERVEVFLEIGCEELPAGWGALAVEHLRRGLDELLAEVPHGEPRGWHTPRRVAVSVPEVARSRPVREKLVTGPPAERAFDAEGRPTRAALGFARGKGVPVEQLELVETPRGRVVAARLREGGESTAELLAAGIEELVLSVPFPKTMRWGEGRYRWARPVHRVVLLLGGERVPARVLGLETTDRSEGHRLDREPFRVTGAADWLEGLRRHHVLADPAERRQRVLAGLREAARAAGVRLAEDGDEPGELLDEVVDLVEWPVVVGGELPARFMELPPRLLVESMRVHQRVFPSWTRDGRLSPRFFAVSNNPFGDAGTIARGNLRVLAARFEDARFFFDEDRKLRLEEHARELAQMRWVRGLGTMADKQERLARLAAELAPALGASVEAVERAARLCKADLATQLVGEFPELQGHVGRLYALHQGEPDAVAAAIEEHYWPRFAGDHLPTTPEGRVLALADRLDSLAGCFSVGLVPRGSADPQGLRRAANGLVLLLSSPELPPVELGLGGLFEKALAPFAEKAKKPPDELRDELVRFALARFRAQKQAEGVPTEVVDAVLAAGGDEPVRLARRVDALAKLAASPDFEPLRVAFRRVMGLSKDHPSAHYDPGLLAQPAERALHEALERVSGEVGRRVEALDYAGALELLAGLKPVVDTFFDEVLVMTDELELREARLGLLRRAAELFRAIADFTRISAANNPPPIR